MNPVTLYGLKACDTCRKAVKALEAGGRAVRVVDVRAEADLPAKLPGWLDAVGADTLVNTRSTTWRGLSETERAKKDADPASLLAEHPALIKRPVIEADGRVFAGWTKDVQAALGV
ncbi:MAG: ArsC/Spx/MgsR family protein [Oceanicaulis sp.]